MPILPVAFSGGTIGQWRVRSMRAVVGLPLDEVAFVDVIEGEGSAPTGAAWTLRGVVGHERYVEATEHSQLVARSPALRRPTATHAALIPIRKSDAWWALSQDERRTVFEAQSRHIATGMQYLPAVARRLHHCRDLGEPFDFLTWFEYAPEDEAAFDELVEILRATPEWRFVDREVDIRLDRETIL